MFGFLGVAAFALDLEALFFFLRAVVATGTVRRSPDALAMLIREEGALVFVVSPELSLFDVGAPAADVGVTLVDDERAAVDDEAVADEAVVDDPTDGVDDWDWEEDDDALLIALALVLM